MSIIGKAVSKPPSRYITGQNTVYVDLGGITIPGGAGGLLDDQGYRNREEDEFLELMHMLSAAGVLN